MSALSYTTETTQGFQFIQKVRFYCQRSPVKFQCLSSLSRSEALSLTLSLCVCFCVCVYITRRLLFAVLLTLLLRKHSSHARSVMGDVNEDNLVQWATKNVRKNRSFADVLERAEEERQQVQQQLWRRRRVLRMKSFYSISIYDLLLNLNPSLICILIQTTLLVERRPRTTTTTTKAFF